MNKNRAYRERCKCNKAYNYIRQTKDLVYDINNPDCDPVKCIRSFIYIYKIYYPCRDGYDQICAGADFTAVDIAGWILLYKYHSDKELFKRIFNWVDSSTWGMCHEELLREVYPAEELIASWIACRFISISRKSESFIASGGVKRYVFIRKSFKT